ncbi:hypothetical protein D187_006210 [Cystobacter fuscus DSM 2262]|uniref:Uncharacterized protein n=1 Tax=Cystobacter fuscus (strain ATCC 25194 / DSM 2262 / NBRC 100088 / M29) TaxID=1242864 RepID=S9PEI2_CYSF2|nr:hypothetical protein D187_006210 [Cystobacter fuscus DSM 2262]
MSHASRRGSTEHLTSAVHPFTPTPPMGPRSHGGQTSRVGKNRYEPRPKA